MLQQDFFPARMIIDSYEIKGSVFTTRREFDFYKVEILAFPPSKKNNALIASNEMEIFFSSMKKDTLNHMR